MGVPAENEKVVQGVEQLRQTKAKVKFLSCEPLLGPLTEMDLTGIDWVIVGGESGRTPRPVREEWVLEILDLCKAFNVKFFFKQWGGVNKKKTGRLLLNKTWDEMPRHHVAFC